MLFNKSRHQVASITGQNNLNVCYWHSADKATEMKVRGERKANIDLIRLQGASSVTGATFWDIYTYTGPQMVDLYGVDSNNQWRKYIDGESPRTMALHILCYMAAQLALSNEELDNVVAKMIEIGASIK